MQSDISSLTVAWSMSASACLMMALMHVLLWVKERPSPVYALAVLMAVAAALNAVSELLMMFAPDTQSYATWLKMQVYAVFLLIVSLVWFVYLYFGTASRTIALIITAAYGVHLAIHVASPDGIVFSELTDLVTASTYWGETFTIARGVRNEWNAIADLTSLLILFYFSHASVRAWKQGNRQRAAIVGGASVLFILLAGIHTPLVDAGLVRTPYMISFAFMAIVAAMSYELVVEAFLASRYLKDIEAGERRWQTLVDTVPVLVVGLDREGRINITNPVFQKASGYKKEELLGMHFTGFLPEDETGRAKAVLRDAFDGKVSPQERIAFVTKQGSRREVVWSNGVVTDGHGQTLGVLSVGADVTDRVRAQIDLEQTRRELDRLTRATLLGEVAAGLAHELNQPLTAILSNAQAGRRMLAKDCASLDEVRSIVDDIIADAKRAGDVVHGLRALLRRGEPMRRPIDFNKVVYKVAELLSGELQAQHIELRLDLADGTPSVHADEVQLQQVLINLLLNAMKAMKASPAGQRSLAVRSRVSDGVVKVSVIDRGPGVAPDLLSRLFDPFVTTRSDGLGMGLAICRRIVEAHGGRISATSNPDGGATLSFTLPVTRHAATAR